MTKEERYAIWNRYYQRHKTEINARRKIIRENYKNKLSKAENKIVELKGQVTRAFEVLEGKRKQIEELEKENAELKDKLKNLASVAEVRLTNWQKYEEENATLKKQLEALSGDIPWNKLKDISEVTKKLTEAKEIIKGFIDAEDGSIQYYDLLNKAEQLLKEINNE